MKKNNKLKKIPRPAKLGFLTYLGDTQGCGTIRVLFPYLLLNHVRERDLMIHTSDLMNYVLDPDFYKEFTFVQFQRSATKMHLELLKHFKSQVQSKYNIPITYEIDDLLFNIPKWNYASAFYEKEADTIKSIMSNCNGMTVSTSKLKELYSEYNKNIEVIPNHLPKFMWGDIYEATDYYDPKDKIKILWAGSQNHFASKMIMGDKAEGGDFGAGLLDFIRKTTDKYDWNIMGAFPVELESVKSKIHFHPWQNIFNYPSKVKSIEPDICIAPLELNEFNESKSNIKVLEYTACGAPGVYSDIYPYKWMSLKAKDDEEFIAHIEKLASDVDYRARIYRKDYNRVESQLWWNETNLKKYINSYLRLFGNVL